MSLWPRCLPLAFLIVVPLWAAIFWFAAWFIPLVIQIA